MGSGPDEHACVLSATGRIVAVTPELPELLNMPLAELLGSDVRDLTEDDEGPNGGMPPVGQGIADRVVRLLTRQGDQVSVLVNGSWLVTRTGDRVLSVRLNREAGEEPLELESDFAVVIVSEDLRVLGWTSGAEQLTGITRASAIGRPCWEILGVRQVDGTPICGPGCALAVAAQRGRDQPYTRVRMRSRRGDRTLDMSTISARLEGQRVLVHRLPLPQTSVHQPRLTTRQLQVLELIGEGLTTAEIAERLVIERVTVKNHIQRVLQALGCHSRVEAVATARRLGLI